jgi:hypothetical protein
VQSRPDLAQFMPKARSRGFEGPNYTQVPNALMDRWLPELSCAELKVLLYLMRRTFGFQREQHAAGLRRICDGTGLHLETVADAVKRLRARGLLSYKGRPGQRNVYTLRFTKEVYGKSEHRCSEKPNTEVYGKSEHVERKSSSETKPKKENYKGRLADQDAEPPKVRQTLSKPIHSNSDDDEPKNRQSYAVPEDELRSIYRNKAGQEISRDLLNRISETCELRGVSMSRFLDELQPHVPNHWKNPAGFLTDFARKFKSKVSGSATAQTSVSALTVKESPRCAKCRGIGRVDGGYCVCQMGLELQRVEQRDPIQPPPRHKHEPGSRP